MLWTAFAFSYTTARAGLITNLIQFTFDGGEVRVITRNGEPWFLLVDVCRVLELGNVTMASARLDADEKDEFNLTDVIGRMQKTIIISEAGLYRLVMRSDKPQAKPFQKWVTAEVLPSIRKTGGYGKQDPMALLNDPAVLCTQGTMDGRPGAHTYIESPAWQPRHHGSNRRGCTSTDKSAPQFEAVSLLVMGFTPRPEPEGLSDGQHPM